MSIKDRDQGQNREACEGGLSRRNLSLGSRSLVFVWMAKVGLVFLVLGWLSIHTTVAQDPLASWNDGPTKQSIISFVQPVTRAGGPDYVAPAARLMRAASGKRYPRGWPGERRHV